MVSRIWQIPYPAEFADLSLHGYIKALSVAVSVLSLFLGGQILRKGTGSLGNLVKRYGLNGIDKTSRLTKSSFDSSASLESGSSLPAAARTTNPLPMGSRMAALSAGTRSQSPRTVHLGLDVP